MATTSSSQSLHFSRLNNPNSRSLSSQERCSIPLITSVALLWTRSNRSVSFFYWVPQSWTPYSRWGLTRAEQRNRIPSLDLLATLLLMQPRIWLAFAHIQFFIHQYHQVLLHRAPLNPFITQSVRILGIALIQVQDLALGLVEHHEVHVGPVKAIPKTRTGVLLKYKVMLRDR